MGFLMRKNFLGLTSVCCLMFVIYGPCALGTAEVVAPGTEIRELTEEDIKKNVYQYNHYIDTRALSPEKKKSFIEGTIRPDASPFVPSSISPFIKEETLKKILEETGKKGLVIGRANTEGVRSAYVQDPVMQEATWIFLDPYERLTNTTLDNFILAEWPLSKKQKDDTPLNPESLLGKLEEKFDVVFYDLGVLEHIHSLRDHSPLKTPYNSFSRLYGFRDAWNVLKPGGRLFVPLEWHIPADFVLPSLSFIGKIREAWGNNPIEFIRRVLKYTALVKAGVGVPDSEMTSQVTLVNMLTQLTLLLGTKDPHSLDMEIIEVVSQSSAEKSLNPLLPSDKITGRSTSVGNWRYLIISKMGGWSDQG
jgi:hypothetical protein